MGFNSGLKGLTAIG